ncbi:hypothetical protein JHL17_34105 [Azospirillum sp. YIM B02556]|uniref:Uncharacterized protein n=1 Tax=Azospirillum endophyticum TaxID=2800326 RepID=A0ABS1FG78_9PROT|nr:hypothetical protein [Azospirillum endophyticum]MBK1842441.1 hypothetical protein [Azospirillum endophyticum]
MIRIDVKLDMKGLQKSLDDFQRRQIPFALAKTATGVAKQVQKAETDAISDIFDRPTLFTQRSVGVKAARKSDLTATVFVKDIAAKYLEPFELGGKHFLPPSKRGGTLLNPKAAQLNQYGNLSKGQLRRLTGRADVFVGAVKTRGGATVSGVWQRPAAAGAKGRGLNRGESLKLLVRFGDALPVKQRLGYRERAQQVVQATLRTEFEKAVGDALRTARG